MKANRRFVNGDDAVSPVIAVILMVAITVVLAATVYLWVSGFGSNQSNLVQASFGAKAVDRPSGDTDSNDDSILLTYVSGQTDLAATDVVISIDGIRLAADPAATTSAEMLPGGALAAGSNWCTSNAGGDANPNWERGASVYLMKSSGAQTLPKCNSPAFAADLANIAGVHQLTVSVKGQVVLDTSIEVHDNPIT